MKPIQFKKTNQVKKIGVLLFLILTSITSYAQSGLNFQGVARSSNNVILASQQISLRLSILQGSNNGNVEYSETRLVTTNAQGLFNVVIGESNATSIVGNFANINWKNTPLFLKIEMDPAAGSNFITMGTTQFQYVAYAQYANRVEAENIAGIVPVARGGTGANSLAALKTALSLDKSSVGLANLDNTSDALKPVSSATQAALDLKASKTDLTTSLDLKVDKVVGKGLSSNDYTSVEKIKLAAITGTNTGDQDLSAYATNISVALKANTNSVTTSLALKEDLSNKSTDVNLGGAIASDTLYPTQKAVKAYVAASKVIADGAITTTKLADLAVTDAKLASGISKSKVGLSNVENTALSTWTGSDNISKVGTINAGTWSGNVIAVNKGGTGGTNSAEARSNLGLEIGTHVQAPLTAGIDYLTPTGSANGLTNFPILNQNTTGTAASANNVTGIVAIENGGTNSTAIPTAGGIGFGNGMAHAYTSAGITGQILSSNGDSDPIWVTPNTISVPYTGATSAVDLGAFDLKVNNLTIGMGAGNLSSNTVLGAYAFNANTTGTNNVAVGNSALIANRNGIENVAVGSSALFKNTLGNSNIAAGASAMMNNEIGNSNTAIGANVLVYNVTGNDNVANGFSALLNNLTGSKNVAIGSNTLATNISGSHNTAIGRDADVLFDGITNSTAIGAGAIVNADNTIQLGNTGIRNVVTSGTMSATSYTGTWSGEIIDIAHGGTGTSVGPFVDVSTDQSINGVKEFTKDLTINWLTIGKGIGSRPNNTVVGRNALSNSDHIGDFNTAIGTNVLSSNVAGNYNTSVGSNALIYNTNGGYNTTIGASSLSSNTTGINNTAVGNYALQSNVEGSSNTAIGSLANVNGSNLFNATAIGSEALVLQSNTIQLGNPSVTSVVTSGTMSATGFVGTWNGKIIDIAHGGTGTNTANFVDLSNDQNIVGVKTFLSDTYINGLTIGKGAGGVSSNTTLGRNAFGSNTSGFDNTAIGLFSLYSNLIGKANTATGRYSLYANTSGEFNTGIGTNALSSNLSGNYNSSLGALALNANTSGEFNSATGAFALYSNTTGENNTANGANALNSNTTGFDNTAIGNSSLASLTIGDDNTAIGSGADVSVGNLTNATAIGAGAIVNASNTMQLGNNLVENVVTSGTISATGFVSATGYGTTSGTSSQFLKANGSVDGTTYVNKNNSKVAIGSFAGYIGQRDYAIGIGNNAGKDNQGLNSISIGISAGAQSQTANAIAIGTNAGLTTQGYDAIGIGNNAGKNSQGGMAIAMGEYSGYNIQKENAIAIGTYAGSNSQGTSAIGIGTNAGETSQGDNAIGIGENAGHSNQGLASIALGKLAGYTDQAAFSIILNATGSALNASTTGFFVAPIQSGTSSNTVYYDPTSKEITYAPVSAVDAGTLTGTTLASNIVSSSLTSVGILQNVTVSGKAIVGTSTATSASAVMEVNSTTQGFLPPRMTTTERNAISSPVAGLTIWNSTDLELEVYNGSLWVNMNGISNQTLTVGQNYQGGKIAYILVSGDPGYDEYTQHGLISATSDQSTGIRWYNGSFTNITATGTAIGTGLSNTNAIILSQGASFTTYAAGLARAYKGGGYTDWYLPSKDELNKLYINRDAIGGFDLNYYWSSTDGDGYNAWGQNMNNGFQNVLNKANPNFVRAIRAF